MGCGTIKHGRHLYVLEETRWIFKMICGLETFCIDNLVDILMMFVSLLGGSVADVLKVSETGLLGWCSPISLMSRKSDDGKRYDPIGLG